MYKNLRLIRNQNSVSVKKMCEIIELETKAAYYKKESGSVKFTLPEAKKIADFFKMSIDEIFFG